jgi:hypothetical protein
MKPGIKTFLVPTVMLVIVAAVAVLLLPDRAKKFRPELLPNPNGYDDFVEAGRSVKGDLNDGSSANTNDLKLFLVLNEDALKRLQKGLSRECRVPLDASPGAATNAARFDGFSGLKRCALLLRAQGRLAELEGRTTDAADAYLQCVRLGCAVTRGGVIIDAQVGLAIQEQGLARLENLLKHLLGPEAAALSKSLEQLTGSCEPVAAILEREGAWAREVFGYKWRYIRILRPSLFKAAEQNTLAKYSVRDSTINRLTSEASARAALK